MDSSAFLVTDSSVTDSSAFTSGKSTNLFLITTPFPLMFTFSHLPPVSLVPPVPLVSPVPFLSAFSLVPQSLSTNSTPPRWCKLVARAQFQIQNSKFSPCPTSPTIALHSQPSHSSHNHLSHSHFPKNFSLYSYTILTIYKRYRKSEQKAKNRRSINI